MGKRDKKRCSWCLSDPVYVEYHDNEWGNLENNSAKLFEMLSLEMMQSGLSWLTILKKRDGMRAAYYNFNPLKLSRVKKSWIESKLTDTRVIRHEQKIKALVNNARVYLKIDDFGSLLWSFSPERKDKVYKKIPSFTPESTAMSKCLKEKGFKFVGPKVCYSLMQSCGMVNDHEPSCWRVED